MSSAVFISNKTELVCQSFSALSASSLKNVSTVSGSHSLSETVLFLSLSLLRLICSEHLVHLLIIYYSGHEYPETPGSVLLFASQSIQ